MKSLNNIVIFSSFLLALNAPIAMAGDAEDLQRLMAAKISITEAIEIAEKAHNGKAIEADLDAMRDGKVVYDVVVVKDDRFYDLSIDATDGSVLSNVEDK
ncbi:MAG: PepSY domain-containing protein [Candidatus Berkiella sp.]